MPYQPIRSGIGRFISGTGAAANLKSNEWTGTGLVVIGEGAMAKTEKCVSGIAIGDRAQGFSRISRDNIAIGADSLINVQAETEWYDQSKMAGTRNIGIGGNAGRGITSGFSNVSIGRNAGQGLGEGSSNIALGAGALAGTAPVGLTGDIEVFWPSPTSKTIAIGEAVLQAYQGRAAQTAIGGNAARNTKTAEKVTVIGANAMESLEQNRAPNGGNVVWTGTETGSYTQSANTITLTFNNIRGAKVNYWVGIRLTSGQAQTLQNDVIPVKVVSVSGNNLTVNSSKELTTSGSAELKFVFSDTSSATLNEELTIIGTNAMKAAVTAGYSTIIGADAALSGENYQKSTAIGASSLRTGGHISTTAIGYWTMPTASSEKCVVIGDSAGYRNVQGDILKNKITNSIAIGYGARINGDNEIQIGTTGQTLYAPTAVNIRSDGRDKTDIKPLSDGLKFVMRLKPVTGYYDRRDAYVDELFQDLPEEERAAKVREWWKNPTKDGRHKEDRQQHWFIAQDIAKLEQEYGRLPMVNIKNDTYTIEYETFIPVLTKAIQELAEKVEKLENENKELKNDKMRN
uniref:Endo N acetylneuraminidase n=1 Tax=Myoviridae sp. ctPSW2 TaxID=2826648 RepID=A0A8S5MN36_9CAUD|nr:MAG TPA: Endo N acetylneuraminidase [Myoviridae sp. ctPSW2]